MASRGRVLVVDDDAAIRESLTTLLELEGYDVLAETDGANALDLLNGLAEVRAPLPSAIVLDIAMPMMDGVEFLAQLAASRRLVAIPVIAISAATRREPGLGRVRAFFRKPLDLGTFLAVMRDTARSAEATGEGAATRYLN
jgi:CheY-like chemotaxis protein